MDRCRIIDRISLTVAPLASDCIRAGIVSGLFVCYLACVRAYASRYVDIYMKNIRDKNTSRRNFVNGSLNERRLDGDENRVRPWNRVFVHRPKNVRRGLVEGKSSRFVCISTRSYKIICDTAA